MKTFIKKAFLRRRSLIFIIDVIMIAISIVIAVYIWLGPIMGIRIINRHFYRIIFMGIVYLLTFMINGLYDFHSESPKIKTVFDTATSVVIGSLFLLVIFFSFPILKFPSRPIFFLNALFVVIFVYLGRLFYTQIFGRIVQNVLIIGAGESGRRILKEINPHHLAGYRVIGFIDDDKQKLDTTLDGIPVLGDSDRLQEVVKQRNIDYIVVAIPHSEKHKALVNSLISCIQSGVEVEDMAVLYEKVTGRIPFELLDDLWFLDTKFGRDTFYKRVLKQMIEKVIAGVVFLMGSPIFFLAIVIQKIFQGGPVFYIQERIGRLGKPFKIVKFRTMAENAEENGPVWAEENDSRVTKLGRFLRLTRIDELPQMINILKGDMSFVGPRPERRYFVERFEKEIPFYSYRLSALPGLTGWAQIKHGYDSSIGDVKKKLEYDLYYIKRMSLFFDIYILLLTMKVIFSAKGN